MLTCAKRMRNGVPVGATITTAELADKFQGLTIATFGGNPVTSVAARAVIEVIEEEKLVENAARVGAYFVSELQRLQDQFPTLVSSVRGRGLMAAFDLPDGTTRDKALKAFMANDVMVLASGSRSARFRPALNLSMDEAAEGIKRMERALKELA